MYKVIIEYEDGNKETLHIDNIQGVINILRCRSEGIRKFDFKVLRVRDNEYYKGLLQQLMETVEDKSLCNSNAHFVVPYALYNTIQKELNDGENT